MILLIHRNAEQTIKVFHDTEEIHFGIRNVNQLFWKLAEEYPKENLVWVTEGFQNDLDLEAVKEVLHHDLIMASYAVQTRFLPDSIGYIDQLPFVKVNRDVLYGTWQMSSDMGAIKAE